MCNRGLYDEKTDNWAVGVVMIVLLTGYPESVQVQETWQKLLRGILPESLIETAPSEKFIELIKMCLTIDYEKRPSCAAILKACENWLHDADDKRKKKTSKSSNSNNNNNNNNKALLISKSVLAVEYEKHVANLLSVCASAKVVSKILRVVNVIQKTRSQRERDCADDGDMDTSLLYDSYVLAEDLEDAARRSNASDVAMQLESLRHLHGSSALTIDLEKLKELESLHRRHDHLYKAIKASASSETKVSEFTQMRENRDVVQSTVHGEMLYAMLYAKNNVSNDNSVRGNDTSVRGSSEKSDWVQEPLHEEVRMKRRSSYLELDH
jgi:serine/threonine protein kinase